MRGMSADDRLIRRIKQEIRADLAAGLTLDEMAERFEERHPARAGRTTMAELRVLVEEVKRAA